MTVLILGAGPAGLLAAHAVRSHTNEEVVIVSKDARKSRLYGCQYLHAYIPPATYGEITQRAGVPVEYRVRGDADSYGRKVYGPDYAGHTSADEYGSAEPHKAWDLRAAYDKLWDAWSDGIVPVTVEGPDEMAGALEYYRPELVFSTIPAPVLCHEPRSHYFNSQEVWAVGDAPDQGVRAPFRPAPFTVECNGEPAPRWYRAANVYDYCTVEWPAHPRPPQEGVTLVQKPLETNCDCFPEVKRLGRYGKWKKGYLAHHAYADAYEAVRNGVQVRLF